MKMPREEFTRYFNILREKHGTDVTIKIRWTETGTAKAEYYVGKIHFATWWAGWEEVVVWEVL